MNYFVLTGGWVLYFTLHSVMASEGVKERVRHGLGSGYRFYRLFYSAVSTMGLVVLLMINANLKTAYFFESEGIIRYLSLMLTTFGVMTIQLAFRQYRLKSFLGFAPEQRSLRREGILKLVRHPIYSGLILTTIGFFLFIPNLATLITCACILAYLPVGIYLEEKKMIGYFGQVYLDYRREVPALIPHWRQLRS